MVKKSVGVEINGCFIEFVGVRGWYFGGGTVQIDGDGNKIEDIE